MNRIIAPVAIVGLMLTASYAFAGDEVSEAGMAQQNKMLKECMARHASSDVKMTKDEMEKACRAEAKSRTDGMGKMSGTPEK